MDSLYPEGPGHKGPSDTGPAAAVQVGRRVRFIRQGVLAALARGAATAEQISAGMDEHFMIVRARLSELRAQGLVTDTSERGRGALGGKVIVWRLTTDDERSMFAVRKIAKDEKGSPHE
jgi:predicted ArsR family transcriptional regulator